jgi:hypothetical protein
LPRSSRVHATQRSPAHTGRAGSRVEHASPGSSAPEHATQIPSGPHTGRVGSLQSSGTHPSLVVEVGTSVVVASVVVVLDDEDDGEVLDVLGSPVAAIPSQSSFSSAGCPRPHGLQHSRVGCCATHPSAASGEHDPNAQNGVAWPCSSTQNASPRAWKQWPGFGSDTAQPSTAQTPSHDRRIIYRGS